MILRTADNVVSGTRLKWYCIVLVLLELALMPPRYWPLVLLMIAITIVASAGIYAFYVRPELRIDLHGVTVVNPLSTTEIAFDELASCEGGAFLTLSDIHGRNVTAWAIQGRNSEVIRGRPTYADEVATIVAQRSARSRGSIAPSVQPPATGWTRARTQALLTPLVVAIVFLVRDVLLR